MKQFESLRKNTASFEKNLTFALEKIKAEGDTDIPIEEVGNRLINDESLLGVSVPVSHAASMTEAIVLEQMRPPYLIIDNEIQIEGDFDRIDLIESNKTTLESIATNVGRVDLVNNDNFPFVGTNGYRNLTVKYYLDDAKVLLYI